MSWQEINVYHKTAVVLKITFMVFLIIISIFSLKHQLWWAAALLVIYLHYYFRYRGERLQCRQQGDPELIAHVKKSWIRINISFVLLIAFWAAYEWWMR